IYVPCEICHGARYNRDTLEVTFRGKTIADVLGMTVDTALELFTSVPKIRKVLQTLHDVGLGYLPLGQAAPTLSGGEAQRVKLAAELARPDTGRTLYILDEPTTGLHFDDVRKLLAVIHRLADLGNTVVIIEHNLEVIKTADWVVDLGPEAGASGGEVVAAGPPEAIAEARKSLTGAILKGVLAAGPFEERPKFDPKAAAKKALAEAKAKLGDDEGRKTQQPWERDGRRWHTRDRVSANGRPARWDGRILDRVVDRIQELGAFAPTDWSQRAAVRIVGTEKAKHPFFHATTSREWVVTLRFHVPRNTFKAAALERQLKLVPFHEAATPVHCDSPRLTVTDIGPTQEILILCHSAEDVETPAFDAFLARGVAAYLKEDRPGKVVFGSELK
ncbi:MAG: ATP-binding cassette domain-containing protein, partial [Isosphaeraceae bacterium]|nr:ATP-binding cassette domain-containing protein [Isosphaeraceae bacterium]